MANNDDSQTSESERRHPPLTSIFTPPSSCLETVTYDGTTLWQNGISQTGDADCYPARFYEELFNNYYSPGVCPQSWTSVGELDHLSGNDAMCCPNGYFLTTTDQGILQNYCFSLFSTPLTNVYSMRSLKSGTIPSEASLTSVNPSKVSNTVYADVIQVQWQDSDQQIIRLMSQKQAEATQSKSSSSGASPGSTAPTAPAQTESAPAAATSASGLSTGAKAGIGVGVALGVLAIAGLAGFLFFFLRRRKRKQQHDPAQDPSLQDYKGGEYYKGTGIHEMDPTETSPPPQEVDGRIVPEAPGTMPPIELPERGNSRRGYRESSAMSDTVIGSPEKSPFGSQKTGTGTDRSLFGSQNTRRE